MPYAALAIDGGQTGIRAQVRRPDGTVDPSVPVQEFSGILTYRPLLEQMTEVVQKASAATGLSFQTVSAGLSGLTDGAALAAPLLGATSGLGVREVNITHDSVSSYLGALGDERGAVIASGTGVVTLAVGAEDVVRIDGWGYIMGDAGSGYWLGRAALDAVMRAYDGRGPQTALTDAVRADYPDLENAYVQLQQDPERISRTASYAAHVARLAEDDAVAASICDAAAAELALSVATGLRRVGEDQAGATSVCYLGGVLRGARVREGLTARLRELWPHVSVREPLATGLDGAAMLPHVAGTSALSASIHTARG
ncbi:N-acetylglucosamine kinase [Zafaria sp. Z1313]|uniref:N-acetylglucosamine kinase n=1 Tax=unclassified Zafaria TaxID=2828765 RepID=UPI002EC29569|nr:BadF/BadG/BcrA/BcrD ATPase family protein [Zafaria sp. J156]